MPTISFHNVFDEIVALLVVAVIAGVASVRLRQPLIIGFLAVGLLAGPSGLNLIKSVDQIHALSEMGLALLLFIVGLKLDVQLIRSMGKVALSIGIGQVVLTTAICFPMCIWLGMNVVTSVYVAMALTFSSTIIIVKLLSDKKEADSLHGRLALGLLIVQDLVVILAMIILSAVTGSENRQPIGQAITILAKGFGLLGSIWVLTKYVLPRLLPFIAKSSELLVLFGIVWALALAKSGELMGFSREIGAFLAGISIASTQYREAIGSRLISLRDFLLLFFFIEFGSRLDLGLMGSQAIKAIPLCIYVLIGKSVIMMIITGALGYRKRTSFLTALTVGQVSEFSLILVAMGANFGHLSEDAVGLVTLVCLVSIAISTFIIMYSQKLFDVFSPYLNIFERKKLDREDSQAALSSACSLANTLIVGMGAYGTGVAMELTSRGRRVLGVDFDPQAISLWNAHGWNAIYGDAQDSALMSALHLHSIRWAVCAIPDSVTTMRVLDGLKQVGYHGYTAVIAGGTPGENVIYPANLMLNPYADAAVQAADLIMLTEVEIARKAMDMTIDSMTDHYLVCGYGRMGQQIAKELTRYNVPCVVVESNPEQLPKLRDSEILHIEGKATEDKTLLKAGIKNAKGLIAVAASDEENVFIVLTAKVLNPGLFVVARSILEENEDKLKHAGANRVMSPYMLGGRRMAAAVIKPEVMDFLDLVVHSESIETEMASITVNPGSACIGKTLKEVNPWETCGVTLLGVRHQGEKLHANPSPEMILMEGDEVIVMGIPSQLEAAKLMLVGDM